MGLLPDDSYLHQLEMRYLLSELNVPLRHDSDDVTQWQNHADSDAEFATDAEQCRESIECNEDAEVGEMSGRKLRSASVAEVRRVRYRLSIGRREAI